MSLLEPGLQGPTDQGSKAHCAAPLPIIDQLCTCEPALNLFEPRLMFSVSGDVAFRWACCEGASRMRLCRAR